MHARVASNLPTKPDWPNRPKVFRQRPVNRPMLIIWLANGLACRCPADNVYSPGTREFVRSKNHVESWTFTTMFGTVVPSKGEAFDLRRRERNRSDRGSVRSLVFFGDAGSVASISIWKTLKEYPRLSRTSRRTRGAEISIVRAKREARPMVREMARSKLHGNRISCNPRFVRSVTRRVRIFPRKEEILLLTRITLPGKENFESFSTRGNSEVKSFAPGTQVADSSTKLRSSPTKERIFSR